MVLVGKIKERDRLEVSAAGKMIAFTCVLKEMRQDLWNGCSWLLQEQSWVVVSWEMNFQIPYNVGSFLIR
jgi:hypothetical protein